MEHLAPDEAGIVVVVLTGELDLTNADELVERIEGLTNGTTPLVVDLNRVVFIDSAAIHSLFQIARQRTRDALAFVFEPTAAVAGTLEIVELDRAATVTASLDEAKEGLRSSRSA